MNSKAERRKAFQVVEIQFQRGLYRPGTRPLPGAGEHRERERNDGETESESEESCVSIISIIRMQKIKAQGYYYHVFASKRMRSD